MRRSFSEHVHGRLNFESSPFFTLTQSPRSRLTGTGTVIEETGLQTEIPAGGWNHRRRHAIADGNASLLDAYPPANPSSAIRSQHKLQPNHNSYFKLLDTILIILIIMERNPNKMAISNLVCNRMSIPFITDPKIDFISRALYNSCPSTKRAQKRAREEEYEYEQKHQEPLITPKCEVEDDDFKEPSAKRCKVEAGPEPSSLAIFTPGDQDVGIDDANFANATPSIAQRADALLAMGTHDAAGSSESTDESIVSPPSPVQVTSPSRTLFKRAVISPCVGLGITMDGAHEL
ncbi:hypothetical protein BXZ70DRAFT_1077409 [Cristinia sonorae]|uniref:Uncharacterized protein n=1 Tax=Cristinia sonorae TaxID=1940300 RepID=A0A8K0UR34_9AGAR|nr:hypothetical protein BXZ70DRAFT_1077409 [Cristinia sonorae]